MREALNYLAALEANNNRVWYHAHKAEKAEADDEFAALVQELLFRSSEDEPELMWRRPEELFSVCPGMCACGPISRPIIRLIAPVFLPGVNAASQWGDSSVSSRVIAHF